MIVLPLSAFASFGTVNGKIAFGAKDSSNNSSIYTINSDGSDLLALAGGDDYAPSWSPDGLKIAFLTYRDRTNSEIYVMNADGTGLRNLTQDPTRSDRLPSWSPDGSKIAFTKYQDTVRTNGDIYVINVDGTGLQNLTQGSTFQDEGPSWSPDGSKIAFSSWTPRGGILHIMNADGSDLQDLVGPITDTRLSGPSWSPDSKKILFHQTLPLGIDYGNLYTVSLDKVIEPITVGGQSLPGSWSPDGLKIVFAAKHAVGIGADLYVAAANGSNPVKITDTPTLDEWMPQWQSLPAPLPPPPAEPLPEEPTVVNSHGVKSVSLVFSKKKLRLTMRCTATGSESKKPCSGVFSVDTFFAPPRGAKKVAPVPVVRNLKYSLAANTVKTIAFMPKRRFWKRLIKSAKRLKRRSIWFTVLVDSQQKEAVAPLTVAIKRPKK